MAFPQTKSRFEDVYDFLVSGPSPQAIIAFRAPAELQARLDELLEFNRNRRLDSEEQAELDEFLRYDDFISELKLRAYQKLADE
jgi:hypothetical protein